MKNLAIICLLALFAVTSCNKKEGIEQKTGISLPPVSSLALQQMTPPEIKLTWTNPTNIPSEISELKIFIEVREVTTTMQSLTVLSITLDDAPTEFTYALPDPSKKYLFTVKTNGTAAVGDNSQGVYATNIYSTGQSVSLN